MVNPILVELTRGSRQHVESAHRGALAVLDADGAVLLALGDIDRPIFPRSAVKALQALPLGASGAADALALADTELALACGSHGGEQMHVEAAASMLAKAGADARVLECGVHWPKYALAARALAARGLEPNALHNNCSGKHAGFVCLAHAMAGGRDLRGFARGYVAAGHPVMREVTAALAAATGCDLDHAPCAIDGCSIPTFGIALRSLASGFARFGSGVGLSDAHAVAAKRLRHAVAAEPQAVAGSGRFDSAVAARLGQRVFCKVGAEGVYCAALPERGLGVAIKIDDGDSGARAAEIVMASVIEALVELDDGEAAFVRGLRDVAVRNWTGIEVGRVVASAELRKLLLPLAGESGG